MTITLDDDPAVMNGIAVFAPVTPDVRRFTLLCVFDGGQWVSLCRELDISSCGDTADAALEDLESAVRDALAFERESGVAAGAPVADDDLADFLESATGLRRATARHLLI